MPNTPFFNFFRSIIYFFQELFYGFLRLLAQFYVLSPLPDAIDSIIILLLLATMIFLIFRATPWAKR